MKYILAVLCWAGFIIAPALASELEDHCVAYTQANEGDPSGCACLADVADADMTEELMAVASAADMENLSAASQQAIAACWPDA